MRLVPKSSTSHPLPFFMVDSSDHVTGKTGLSPTVTIRKVGGSFASPSGSVTEIANGWYQVAGNATDSDTNGPLLLHATASGADPVDTDYMVGYLNSFDAVRFGMTALPNAAADAAGGVPISDAGGLDMDALATNAGTAAGGTVSILARLGSMTGTGVNTVLGMFKALLSKTASTPSDIGGTFDPATDSTEAIRDRGDAAWITATGFSTSAALATAQADLDLITGLDGAVLAAAQPNYAPSKPGDAMALTSGERSTLTGVIWTALDATQFAKFFSVDSGTAYASAVAGSVVKEIADNAGGGGGGTTQKMIGGSCVGSGGTVRVEFYLLVDGQPALGAALSSASVTALVQNGSALTFTPSSTTIDATGLVRIYGTASPAPAANQHLTAEVTVTHAAVAQTGFCAGVALASS